MALAAGAKLGPYEITSPLGAGGMGDVYLAQDARLSRSVAIKILPDKFSCDADRMARFDREAKVLASLNHPNIAAIYGLEESNNVRALVMELVDGPTLAERIKQGQLPLDETLSIAKQIAEALEYAHERSIIHRDLKPSNVKITPNGAAKVLDFGLAKALEDDFSAAFTAYVWLIHHESPTKVGTYAYVNPVVAVLLGYFLGGEALGPRTILGTLFVLISVILITTTSAKKAVAPRLVEGEERIA
ncbi:MAG TPA: protein kinase [Candidatus Acidoferrum sp.]|jgi:serine/threonine protein kinase